MDYIRDFDIRLDREMYYAGEKVEGHVYLDTVENFKLRAVRVVLRGKAHVEWSVVLSGDRRTLFDEQHFVEDRAVIWGKDQAEAVVPVLPRGLYQFPFSFQLPETSLPCSFESKCGYIRYCIKVTVDIPYASPPQGLKYFTLIGPHIHCMDEHFLKPVVGEDAAPTCCLCCARGAVSLRTQLERTAYCSGESLKLRAAVDNQGEEPVRLKVRLVQHVEYFIDRGMLGVSKDVQHPVLEFVGEAVAPRSTAQWDSADRLRLPTMPPSLVGVCRLLQIYYVLKVNLEFEKSGDDLQMHFPVTVATVPFRMSDTEPDIQYQVASEHVEGGLYIGPEFLLGQVYDGSSKHETVVLYRPVYVTVAPSPKDSI